MISWAPHETGCLLACASSDGHVSVLEFRDNSWTHQIFHAHGMGVNSISWAPAAAPGSLISSNPGPGQQRRFVTGGSDNLLKIWDYRYGLPFISNSSVTDDAQKAPKRIPTTSHRHWKGTPTGFGTSPGRPAFSPSHTLPLRHRIRQFVSGRLMRRILHSGRARCLSSTLFCGG
jgi:WD40 repeat protein